MAAEARAAEAASSSSPILLVVFLVVVAFSAVAAARAAPAPARARAAGDAGGRRGGAGRPRLRRRPRRPRGGRPVRRTSSGVGRPRPPAAARADRRRPAGRMGAPPGRLRRQGLAQPRAGRARSPPSSTSAWSTARRTRRTAPSCASAPRSTSWVQTPAGQRIYKHRPRRPADRVRRVLDAGQARRRLDARLDRAGRRGHPPPHRRDRRLAVVRQPPARRGAGRAGRGRPRARGLRARRRGQLSTSPATHARRRWTCRWPTRASCPTCSRPPCGARPPRGPRPSTARTRALERVASPEAIDALLYGGDAQRRTRLVVRGPRIERVVIERVDAQAHPARMTVAIDVRGRRYREDRDTAAVAGGLARARGDLPGALGAGPRRSRRRAVARRRSRAGCPTATFGP